MSAREQRRLAAIVAADVVGYSRLMGRDEAGTVARLRLVRTERLEPVIARRGGRIVKLTGDGALIEFSSAVEALSAAIEFQQAMAESEANLPEQNRLVFRVGVHLGDVIVDGDDLYGDGVNVAARLEGEAPAGGIVSSSAIYEAASGRLPATFCDLGRLALKNIERPLQAYSVVWQPTEWQIATAPLQIAAVPPAVNGPHALPDKPSIAVLPFQNMSGDPEQEYFTDGVTEDIITELSRFHSLFVIARNSSFIYKGKPLDVRQIGRELGVRYVLEGSIRRAGHRIRISAQLNDTLTGNHIWAERYDRIVDDVFEVQEEVTQAIVTAIAPQIESAEIAKTMRRRPENLGAYELALRAWAEARDGWTKSEPTLLDRATNAARQALAMDAQCGLALVAVAFSLWQRDLQGSSSDGRRALEEGEALTTRAIEIDASNHLALTIRGLLRYRAGQRQAGLDDLRQAHKQNPNDAMTLMCLGFTEALFGDPETGTQHEIKALRLSPRDYWRSTMHANLAISHFLARQYNAGKEAAQAAVREAPQLLPALNLLALNLVGLGQVALAASTVDRIRMISPTYLNERLAGRYPFERQDDVIRATTFIRVAAGLEDPSVAEPLR